MLQSVLQSGHLVYEEVVYPCVWAMLLNKTKKKAKKINNTDGADGGGDFNTSVTHARDSTSQWNRVHVNWADRRDYCIVVNPSHSVTRVS